MDLSTNPFPTKAPKFLRSKLYNYHFTTDFYDSNWWNREEGEIYSPMISKDDPPAIKEYLTKIGILTPPKKSQKSSKNLLARLLKFLRAQIIHPHHYLVLVLVIAAVPFFYDIRAYR